MPDSCKESLRDHTEQCGSLSSHPIEEIAVEGVGFSSRAVSAWRRDQVSSCSLRICHGQEQICMCTFLHATVLLTGETSRRWTVLCILLGCGRAKIIFQRSEIVSG